MAAVSLLRRPFLYDRYLFVTVDLLRHRRKLDDRDYVGLASALTRMRRKHGFFLTAWVFLPDHWHAIIYPPYPLSISRVFQSVKVSSTIAINVSRREAGELWQIRFFDRALRSVKEYMEKVEYIHLNPVRRGLVMCAEEWIWSSVHEYAGRTGEEQEKRCGLRAVFQVSPSKGGGGAYAENRNHVDPGAGLCVVRPSGLASNFPKHARPPTRTGACKFSSGDRAVFGG